VLKLATEAHLLIAEETPWGDIEVWQDGSMRYLHIQGKIVLQSQLDMAQKEKLQLPHSRAMMSFLLFQSNLKPILLFGVGGGSIIHFLCYWFPALKITAVDVNDKVLNIAKKYFAVSNTSQVSIQVADALTYLAQTQPKNVGVILVDIHDGKRLPDFLYQHDFMAQCFHALSSEGMVVINVLVYNDQDLLDILKALRQCFTGISLCMTVKEQQNVLLFAFKSLSLLDMSQLRLKAIQYQQKYGIEFDQFMDNIITIDVKKP